MTNSNVNGPEEVINEALNELIADDVFLTQISRGADPSDGADPLADLLLSLRDEISADMPAAPTLEELGVNPTEADKEPADSVIDLGAKRAKRRRFGTLTSGFIGAAAATLLIAGCGSAIYAAKEGSVLYGLKQQVFKSTDHAAVVELASKLEEANSLTKSGDVEGAKEVLAEVQDLVSQLNAGKQAAAQPKPEKTQPQAATTTVTVTEAAPTQEPITTTVTVTVEPAAPIVAPPQVQNPQPSTSVEPPSDGGSPSAPAGPPDLQVPEEYR